ncbi:wings apart-like protein regulation of heterochromatin domain-containing protein [Phthorimaea operculella]|nr:wings apart-like protein regulation of heterochromatin domain-containing protein [Phthorimaea operculella]
MTSSQLAKTQERVRELCAEIKSQGKAQHLDLDNITLAKTQERVRELCAEIKSQGKAQHLDLDNITLAKTQERVRELCAEIKSQGKAQHLDLDNITVGHLAMETLLSLTSKRAGEWFKEELRVLGGVDHIVRTIQDCAARLGAPALTAAHWDTQHHDILRKADRCMRVLENVTQQNEDNQMYLLTGSLGAAATLAGLLRLCATEARDTSLTQALRTALLDAALPAIKVLVNLSHSFGNTEARDTSLTQALRTALLDAALPAIKVLVNLSHSFGNTGSLGAKIVGEQPSVIEICLIILNNQGNFIPDDRNFEFSVCVLMLLINLVQNSEANTQRLFNTRIRVDNEDDIISRSIPALELIRDLFYKRDDLARRAEENTDALLDGENVKKQSQDDIDETVAKLLARAGTHMEHTMVGAYIALLLGNMALTGPDHHKQIRALVPEYQPMLPTLNKYFTFLTLTASVSNIHTYI